MELIEVKIEGFRRFTAKTSINVDSRMIAVVGPNEAGKSSLLRALEHLNHNSPFQENGPSIELSRGKTFPNPDQVIIEALFILENEDLEAIKEIENTKNCKKLVVYKTKSGERSFKIEPPPRRSLKIRTQTLAKLSKSLPKILQIVDDDESDYEIDFEDEIKKLSEALKSEKDGLPSNVVSSIRTLSQNLLSSGMASKLKELHSLAEDLETLTLEEDQTPLQRAGNILWQRLPQFRLFGDEERELEAEYSLEELQVEVPTALDNLLNLAGLDLSKLQRLVSENDRGEIATTIRNVNRHLSEVFKESWTQSSACVQLDVDGESLFVFVNEADEPDSRLVQIAERSDGLRQYVALLSFVRLNQSDRPTILLIDEAETHLHYDAQADLVQMLTRQNLVDKVIYTTHSIGCLPEDLGMGVRMVEKVDVNSSKVINWFWTGDGEGFSPLLFGMGAQTLAFIPVRFAVIGEGASDMILLPSLLREAGNKQYLGFQIVPGLSESDDDALIQLEQSSKRTAYLTDSDQGGLNIVKRLLSKGLQKSRVFSLPLYSKIGTISEDFVNPELYVKAVNTQLHKFQNTNEEFDIGKLPSNNRVGAIEAWCKKKGLQPPNKRAVAYYIVEDTEIFPKVDRDKRSSLSSMLLRIQQELDLIEK